MSLKFMGGEGRIVILMGTHETKEGVAKQQSQTLPVTYDQHSLTRKKQGVNRRPRRFDPNLNKWVGLWLNWITRINGWASKGGTRKFALGGEENVKYYINIAWHKEEVDSKYTAKFALHKIKFWCVFKKFGGDALHGSGHVD